MYTSMGLLKLRVVWYSAFTHTDIYIHVNVCESQQKA